MKKILLGIMFALILIITIPFVFGDVSLDDNFDKASRWNDDGTIKIKSEPGTNEAVDEIMKMGKEDANHYNNIYEIINILKGDILDPWKDEATMEKYMYYGRVLECSKYSTGEEKAIGVKAYEVVKYVYRNQGSKEEANITHANLVKKINNLKD